MDNNIHFSDEYHSYNDFYDENKKTIYKKIVDVFEYLIDNNLEEHTIHLFAKIGSFSWSSDIIFRIKDKDILEDFILQYFEETEEYEYCQKIKELLKKESQT